MRIVAHNGARIVGGAERATILLLSGLQSRGHDVLLLCNDASVAAHAVTAGIPAKIAIIGGDVSLIYAKIFSDTLSAERPDAVIISTWKKLFFASRAAKRAGARKIVARVGLETDTPRSVKYRYALRHWTDNVVVNAETMAPAFTSLDGFGPTRVRVIHNGVGAPERQSPTGALREQLGIPVDARVVGTVARLAKQKRLDRLLRVVSSLPANVHCIVAGDGPERSALIRQTLSVANPERVHFLGHRENKGDILDALDAFVLTSDKEGLSNAMLEAMAFGLPVVSTPVSGALDALGVDGTEGPAGIVTGFDEASITAALLDLLDAPQDLKQIGTAARARATTKFSLDTMLDKWEVVLTP
ncbi:MAG: glycosyltransferase family 4 protein [Gemmatimonadaceae bacterium]